MKIFKFGGASVKSADGVKNLTNIVSNYSDNHIIVISAMDKMTNVFENLCRSYFDGNNNIETILEEINTFHLTIINELFDAGEDIHSSFEKYYNRLLAKLDDEPSLNYDFEYDQIVCYGEIFSTLIVSEYLNKVGQDNKWIDIRGSIKTDDTFREGKLDWVLSSKLCNKHFQFENTTKYVTQGFIAGTTTNQTTTLGREGSDYTAAILANLLDAENVTIWKDVPGIMNADPKEYEDAEIIKQLTYKETIELAHFGAKVIHPNTIKPLHNKNIPLFVKSFISPLEQGSIVCKNIDIPSLIPIFIHKREQVLISLSPRDYSFIGEGELCNLFSTFKKHNLKINLVQSSAISFSICCDQKTDILTSIFENLKKDYHILYNKNTELITVSHQDDKSIERVTKDRHILLEQRTRQTARFVVDNK